MNTPLLGSPQSLPDFDSIEPEEIPSIIVALLHAGRQRVAAVLDESNSDWQHIWMPLEEQADELERAWAPIRHLHAVCDSEALRKAYQAVLPELTRYQTEMGQNRALYDAYQRLANTVEQPEQHRAVQLVLQDFKLSGVALEEPQRSRFAALRQQLAELSNRFANHVLDATQGWALDLDHADALPGVPESVLVQYREAAASEGRDGLRITLDIPSYLPAMQYCSDRAIRRELYTAYVSRASDQGPCAGRWDNGPIMDEILCARHELAGLLGFANYAELSLAPKMAESTDQVETFLLDLAARARPIAKNEVAELQAFARAMEGDRAPALEAWDITYYSEWLKRERYRLDQEELRPYFPFNRVLTGLFAVVEKLFGVQCVQRNDVSVWHPDVRYYAVLQGGEEVAGFYLDPYARSHKRGGAWMADCRVRRRRADGTLQRPVAFLTCNFTPPAAGRPSLLTHDEVTTLFHEFGHGLHHMLTRIDVASISGINGVPWDAVELPSQFLENWCWQREAIPLLSGHHESGEPLPEALLDCLLEARNFQAALQLLRQIEFALFDLRLHRDYRPDDPAFSPQAVLDQVRAEIAVLPVPDFNRFQHSFSHIFAGGYAAGYYSYKWAELLSADAFSAFEEEGIFNAETGQRFRRTILERGGSAPPEELFRAFRGRDPQPEALLRHSGLHEAMGAPR